MPALWKRFLEGDLVLQARGDDQRTAVAQCGHARGSGRQSVAVGRKLVEPRYGSLAVARGSGSAGRVTAVEDHGHVAGTRVDRRESSAYLDVMEDVAWNREILWQQALHVAVDRPLRAPVPREEDENSVARANAIREALELAPNVHGGTATVFGELLAAGVGREQQRHAVRRGAQLGDHQGARGQRIVHAARQRLRRVIVDAHDERPHGGRARVNGGAVGEVAWVPCQRSLPRRPAMRASTLLGRPPGGMSRNASEALSSWTRARKRFCVQYTALTLIDQVSHTSSRRRPST